MPITRTERPVFYEEQYLGAEDLNAAVEFTRQPQARHNLGGHIWGIVMGLQLIEKTVQTSSNDEVDVFVQPGYAWDGFGRPIVVLAPARLPKELFSRLQYDPGTDNKTPKGRLVKVWIHYEEAQTQPPRAGFTNCNPDESFGRVQETYRFEIGERQPDEQHDKIFIAGREIEARLAITPEVHDESIPFQELPAGGEKRRWLIPLGSVRWYPNPNSTQPGNFEPRDDADLGKSESQRRYIGVVAGSVEAASHKIRMHDRTQPYSTVLSDDLVQIEGKLRVDQDARLFGGQLDFRNSNGEDLQLRIRHLGDDPKSNRWLQAAIGLESQKTNRFAVGTLDPPDQYGNEAFHPKFVVLSEGNVGIGTDTPLLKLEIRGKHFGRDDDEAILHLFGSRIGDIDNKALFIRAAAGGVVTFDGGNPVGVGTANPQASLQVTGGAIMPEVGNSPSAGIQFPSDPGKGSGDEAFIRYFVASTGTEKTKLLIGINNDKDDTLGFHQMGKERMTIYNGKVGIGTTTPDYALDVVDQMRVQQGLAGPAGIWFYQSTPNKDQAFVGMESDERVGFFGNGGGWGLVMNTKTGQVGIGTKNPEAALQVVNGAIMPAVGNSESAGIQFPPDPSTGGLDRAFIRYFVTSPQTEITKLLIGIDNDPDDTLGFHQWGKERMTIYEGKVGIGTTTPFYALDIVGDLNITGQARKPTGVFWTNTSDLRLKQEVRPILGALNRLLHLRGVSFAWKEPEKMGNQTNRQMGLIAQEVMDVIPEWVSTSPDGYLELTITGFEALVIEAIRELHTEIENLEARLEKASGALTADIIRP